VASVDNKQTTSHLSFFFTNQNVFSAKITPTKHKTIDEHAL
jgi:hypothetical protein